MQTATLTNRTAALNGFAATLPGRILIGLAATAVVAASAHIAIPLPFTPVPFIMTPLAVLGVGLAFGPIGGFLVMLAYLAEGAAGLPVFSPTGPGGILQLFGPTGGFLMAYPLVAALAGGLTRAWRRVTPPFVAAAIAGHIAMALLLLSGAAWFMQLTHLSVAVTLTKTVLPFIPGEIVKVFAAAGIYSALTRSPRT
jgi:biotin transport system substrate-specific component